jgi:tetratricopeptide (TPR) repeat protein
MIAEEAGNPYSLAHATSFDGLVHLLKGDLPQAIRPLERFIELCRTWTISMFYPAAAARLGYAYILDGRLEEGLPLLEEAVEQGEVRRTFEHVFMLAWLAEASLLSGRPERSLELAQRALQIAEEGKQRGKLAHVLYVFGEIYAQHGPWRAVEAEKAYRNGLDLAEELGMRPLQAHCHLGLGSLLGRGERLEEARAALTSAIELYRSMEMQLWLPRAEAELQAIVSSSSVRDASSPMTVA